MIPSILTFEIDLILVALFIFCVTIGLFLGGGRDKTVLVSTHVKLLICMFSSILTLDFELNLCNLLLFGVLLGYFWSGVQILFGVYLFSLLKLGCDNETNDPIFKFFSKWN